jgi:serine/threonine protein phosphatase PrpC
MNVGLRDGQEDCVFINGKVLQERVFERAVSITTEETRGVFAVCDGMGGHSRGEWASRFVCSALRDALTHFEYTEEFIEHLAERIQNYMENEMIENSGTTIAGVVLDGDNAIIFNAGDSRVYKITKNSLIYLSHDHSLVQYYVDIGYLSRNEAFGHQHKNVIDFGIGDVFKSQWADGARKIYVRGDDLGRDECYLICTDGVNDVMNDDEISAALLPDPFERISDFTNVLTGRMKDNFSFILLGNA